MCFTIIHLIIKIVYDFVVVKILSAQNTLDVGIKYILVQDKSFNSDLITCICNPPNFVYATFNITTICSSNQNCREKKQQNKTYFLGGGVENFLNCLDKYVLYQIGYCLMIKRCLIFGSKCTN